MATPEYPWLNNVWLILCGEYGVPKGAPSPKLLRTVRDVKRVELHASTLTMGQLGEWLDGNDETPRDYMLREVMCDLFNEVDNV